MTNQITSAMPLGKSEGINDESARQVPLEPTVYPQHVAFVPIYAKNGPEEIQFCSASTRNRLYGKESFDERGPWATHSTVLSNVLAEAATIQATKRMRPLDAGPNASVRLYADVLRTKVDQYERNTDGSYKLDPVTRQPIVKAGGSITAGVTLRFGVDYYSSVAAFNAGFGAGTMGVGAMTDSAGNTSVMYPLWEGSVPNFGDSGNGIGFRMWAPTDKGMTPVNRAIMDTDKVYPFRLMFVSKDNPTNSSAPIQTTSGEVYIEFTLKPDTVSKTTGEPRLSLHDVIKDQYRQATIGQPVIEAPMSPTYVYDEYIKEVLGIIFDAEKPYADEFSDITSSSVRDDGVWLMNPFTATSSRGVPYTAVTIAAGGGRMTMDADHFARGGSDGTMSLELFDKLVAKEMTYFADPGHQYSEILRYPVSDMYDSGYGNDVKYDIMSFMSSRKDTFVVASTHVVGQKPLTPALRSSMAVILSGYAKGFPESELYGTHACRAMVMGSSGYRLNSSWSKRSGDMGRLPLTLWLAKKAANYMGAGDRRWKSEKRFNVNPGNIIDDFTDIDVTFTSSNVRHKDWDNGLVYPQYFDTNLMFFAGLQTVYDDDTSILNNYFTVKAACYLEKVGMMAWRKFVGTDDMSNPAFEIAVKNYIEEEVIGLFDDRFVIKARCYHTKIDELSGFSFHTEIIIYGENMKTLMTYNLTARRRSELTATTA